MHLEDVRAIAKGKAETAGAECGGASCALRFHLPG